ncbi:MAG: ABC transporter six-transmembrane domain-containing protein [Pseudomonadota bacterium]
MIKQTDRLSIGTLFRAFPYRIGVTWGLTLIETTMFALLPLLIGWSIDGLLADDWESFQLLITALAALLCVAIFRRVYDTRAYGTMRVQLGKELVRRSQKKPVSVTNARVLMGRELVDFMETTAPESLTAFVQVIVSIVLLFSFHSTLALSAGAAAIGTILIYALFARYFFRINGKLNTRLERQVKTIEGANVRRIALHFAGLRRAEVRLSDAESLVYGLIFVVLLTMLAFNLWFAATQSGATPGQIFSIVSYSYEFVQASVALPAMLQALTRLEEITRRINQAGDEVGDA